MAVPVAPSGFHDFSTRNAGTLASGQLSPLLALEIMSMGRVTADRGDAIFKVIIGLTPSRWRADPPMDGTLAIIPQSEGLENFAELTRDKSYYQETKREPNRGHHKHRRKRLEIDFWISANSLAPMNSMYAFLHRHCDSPVPIRRGTCSHVKNDGETPYLERLRCDLERACLPKAPLPHMTQMRSTERPGNCPLIGVERGEHDEGCHGG
jgi:hypothetical protein